MPAKLGVCFLTISMGRFRVICLRSEAFPVILTVRLAEAPNDSLFAFRGDNETGDHSRLGCFESMASSPSKTISITSSGAVLSFAMFSSRSAIERML